MFQTKKNLYFILLILFFSLFSCKSKIYFNKGLELYNNKNWDEAVSFLIKALGREPDNVKYRLMLAKALISSSEDHYKKGEYFFSKNDFKMALVEFEKSLDNNPENNKARRKKYLLLKKIREINKENKRKEREVYNKLNAKSKNPGEKKKKFKDNEFTIDFHSIDLKHLFRVLEKSEKVNFLFDEGFKSKKIHIQNDKTTILKLLDNIMLQSKLFYKIIDENTILIIPDTPQKRKKYEELVMRTFFLNNSEPENIAKIIKSISGIKSITINKKINAIIVKGKLEKVKLAERLVEINDKSKGEILIDIEIIEVNRRRIKEYGIELSDYGITENYSSGGVSDEVSSGISVNSIPHINASDFILNLPSIHYKLMKSDQNSKIKARPHIRVIDGEKIEVKLGDKVPIPTTSFVPQYGGTSVNNQPITSYKLEDIGINIDIEPKVHLNGWVTIKLEFELTFISSPGDILKGTPPTIGNRSVKTLIRLKDNETSILAGLLRDTERKSITGFPLISKIPILKDIFSGNKKEVEQTDIILTLTPRIIRYPDINDKDTEYIWVGTQTDPGVKSAPAKFKDELSKEKTEKISEKKEEKKVPVPNKIKKPVILGYRTSDETIKSDSEFSVSITLSDAGKNRNIRVIKGNILFDPGFLKITKVEKGDGFISGKLKGNTLKRFDNDSGKLNLNISLESGTKIETSEIITIFFLPKKKGRTSISVQDFSLFNKKLKKVITKTDVYELVIH